MATFVGNDQTNYIRPDYVSPGVIADPSGSTPNNGHDLIFGRGGNDQINGGGNDLIYAGAGDDWVNLWQVVGVDTVFGGVGNDIIVTTGWGIYGGGEGDDRILSHDTGAETLNGGAGYDFLQIEWPGDIIINLSTNYNNQSDKQISGFEKIWTASGNDRLTGNDGHNRFESGNGGDFLNGLAGDDWLENVAGDATIWGGAGDDTIYGGRDGNVEIGAGSGDDFISATGAATAIVFGGLGHDNISSGFGDDTIDGGAGNDTIYAGYGNDVIKDRSGRNDIQGSLGDDTIRTYEGQDTLDGGYGDDFMSAGADNDLLQGLFGNDTMFGGSGSDTLNGGAGADALTGGAGNDIFLFENLFYPFEKFFAVDSKPGAADTIRDFEGAGRATGDVMDLRPIDADETSAGNDTFTFRGELTWKEGMAKGSGALWVTNVGEDTIVRGNQDGDTDIELYIRLTDGQTVAADYHGSDFLLQPMAIRRVGLAKAL